jgi:hypothetical protein
VTVPHHLGLRDAHTMDTTALQLAKRAINDLVEFSAMGVIHGPAGTGKTFAWRTAVAELEVPVCAVQFPSRPSMLRIAQVLLRELSGQTPRGSRFTLSDALLDILSDRSRLLVIDEAQWLNRDCIEFIRHLHDDPKTQFGLALVGGDGCWQILSREPMLRSRLYHRVTFAPLASDSVLRVIPGFHPLYADVDLELLALVDDRFAHGYFRDWVTFTHTASRLCKELGQPLDEKVARAVFALHDGGRHGD